MATPIAEAVIAQGGDFLFTCKPDSHKTLYDFIAGAVHAIMTKTITQQKTSFVPVTTMEEVPVLSDEEREPLRASLDQARAEITAGNFDELTSERLRAEFDAVFYRGKTGAEIDAELAKTSGKYVIKF